MAELPEWLRQGKTDDGYAFGKLGDGSYVVQVPGYPQALHLDLQRKMFSSVNGSTGRVLEEKIKMERAWEELGRRGIGSG